MKRHALRLLSLLLASAALFLSAPAFPLSAYEEVGGGGNAAFHTSVGELTSLGLSVVLIDTADGDYVTTRIDYKEATMRVVLSEKDAAYQNAYTSFSGGGIRIKGRGNYSWNKGYADGKKNTPKGASQTRKAPYTVRLDKKADLFGLGKSKTWTFLANYYDRTTLRNKTAYDFSGRIGMVYSKSTFVNLVLNGEYMGVYQVCQKINEDLLGGEVTDWEDIAEEAAAAVALALGFDEEKRQKLEDGLNANASWITGGTAGGYRIADYYDLSPYNPYAGYLLEYDSDANEPSYFKTPHGIPIKVKNLESIKTNNRLYLYLTGFLSEFEEALFSPTFCNSKGKHYSEYLDVNSAVDYFLVYMVMMNRELGNRSFYMYINQAGKLVFGPVWDFDHSNGNLFLKKSRLYTVWNNSSAVKNNRWYQQLYRDPWFVALVRERWPEIRDEAGEILTEIDEWKEILAPTEELEYAKFAGDPYEELFVSRTAGRTFSYEATDLGRFLTARMRWLDAQLGLRDPGIEDTIPDGESQKYITDLSFKLTAKGKSSALTLSAPSEKPYAADGISAEFQDVTVETTLKRGDDLTVLVNGAVLFSDKVTDPRGKVSVTVPAEAFAAGINVIAFYRNPAENSRKTVYFSVAMPGEKRPAADPEPVIAEETAAPEETALPESGETASPEEALTGPETAPAAEPGESGSERDPYLLVFTLLLCVAAAAIVFDVYLLTKKGKKSPPPAPPDGGRGA
ncbi:MAG: CotH kinase family protein [Clostridia bacterium]|nr:CotH kinase family protein [Clostridia bacterium]